MHYAHTLAQQRWNSEQWWQTHRYDYAWKQRSMLRCKLPHFRPQKNRDNTPQLATFRIKINTRLHTELNWNKMQHYIFQMNYDRMDWWQKIPIRTLLNFRIRVERPPDTPYLHAHVFSFPPRKQAFVRKNIFYGSIISKHHGGAPRSMWFIRSRSTPVMFGKERTIDKNIF